MRRWGAAVVGSVEEIRRLQIDPNGAGRFKEDLLLFRRDQSVRAAPLARVGPAMHAADMDANHLGNRCYAAAFVDYFLSRVHGI